MRLFSLSPWFHALSPGAIYCRAFRAESESPPAERMASKSPPEGGKPTAPGKRSAARGLTPHSSTAPVGETEPLNITRFSVALPGLPTSFIPDPGPRFACPGLLAVRPGRGLAVMADPCISMPHLVQRTPERPSPSESHRQRRWFP
jgi:hypothetical protein